ncbi:MAG: histidinol-phosphate aminotransferase family protein [Bacteroidetes bacterium]|nr:histidinol-phosphate aminotransferase family protein [Bacteroidota bacterium]
MASAAQREMVYRLRHDVYAKELGQYSARSDGTLPDPEEVTSSYIIATVDDDLVGFVGVTPPTSARYSVDRYLDRSELPVVFDDHIYEVRALTVTRAARGSHIAALLMYAAFRLIESSGGHHILSIGRREVLGMYLRMGLRRLGRSFTSGAVTYDLISGSTEDIARRLGPYHSRLHHMEADLDWQLDVPFLRPAACYHGGAFFEAIGDQFDDLQRRKKVISADVLDAWFPPAPSVQSHLRDHLDWIIRTSPPTHAAGLGQVIARTRGAPAACILTGAGSSDLIFLAFRQWLQQDSRVLLLDPTYGEYSHVLHNVIGCRVERLELPRSTGYQLPLDALQRELRENYDLFVWVNPNSPTGLHTSRWEVEAILNDAPSKTRIWIDETYVEYAGVGQSLEPYAAASRNAIVCKSMSKVYALSGLRAAYLCAAPAQLERLRSITPPWAVSLPAQIAATHALQSREYYTSCVIG